MNMIAWRVKKCGAKIVGQKIAMQEIASRTIPCNQRGSV
jgi:hypothetical protein